MPRAYLEHVNFTVSDPEITSRWLCDVFGWTIRWKGESIYGGTTFHVGGSDSYIALYSIGHSLTQDPRHSYHVQGGMNHVAIVVEDIDATETRVIAHGFATHSHADYEPGRRFYFRDTDGIEFEVVSYG
jgi:catechol 2,3-dioxygenase-like lactoylglutathione lyase family enzyme